MANWTRRLAELSLDSSLVRGIARVFSSLARGTARFDRAAPGFALALALIACALPLTGSFGPESALLFALTLSPWAGALGVRAASSAPAGETTGALLARAIAQSWRLLAIPVALLALNGLRADPCDPIGGLRFFALGPWPSITLSALIGVALGASRWRWPCSHRCSRSRAPRTAFCAPRRSSRSATTSATFQAAFTIGGSRSRTPG